MAPMLVPFQMFGAPIAAAVNDSTGRYESAVYGFVAACGVGALLLGFVRIPARVVNGSGDLTV
jgi:hypothetical protein